MQVKRIVSYFSVGVAFFVATFFLFSFLPLGALAQGTAELNEVGTTAGFATDRSLEETVGSIINVFLGTLGVIFLLLVIYSGFLWMTAGGSGDKVEKAKKILINGVIGLLITLMAYGITTFVLNALSQAGLTGGGAGVDIGVGVEPLSGSLGAGAIRDHYPQRFQTDVPRNTKISVTFRGAMFLESFIEDYEVGDPLDPTDDVLGTQLNADMIKIYRTADGRDGALESDEVTVGYTDDHQTFVFSTPILGSDSEDTNYSVYLDDSILDDGDGIADDRAAVLNLGGYEWTFTVGTELDLTPPRVISAMPSSGGTYDRNIVIQLTFNEAIDPTSAQGSTSEGFSNIRTLNDAVVVDGRYEIANGYKTVTFVTSDICGENSCGEGITCLPSDATIHTIARSPAPGDNPPQVDTFPYLGIVDMAANALDGDGDGEVGIDDDFDSLRFLTTGDINFSQPHLASIVPDINAEDIPLDQPVRLTFGCSADDLAAKVCDSVLMASTVNSDALFLQSSPEHEMWYRFDLDFLPVDSPVKLETDVRVLHGVFLESTLEQSYAYAMSANEKIKNQYQNCFVPVQGPSADGGICEGSPYCCNGDPSVSACSF
jgi:hypothetical protein